MRRELMEEVAIDEMKEAVVAVINDDSTEVGQVHFGVVHVVHVADENVAGSRSGIVSPEFVPMAEAIKDPSGYESWSPLLSGKSGFAAIEGCRFRYPGSGTALIQSLLLSGSTVYPLKISKQYLLVDLRAREMPEYLMADLGLS